MPTTPELEQQLAPEMFSAIVPLTDVDVRDPSANPDNTWTMSGYAAVFNQQAVYYDSKFLRVIVEIDQDAFSNVLRTQPLGTREGVVHFNMGHDMNRAVAATDVAAGQAGSLQLSVDAHGLRYLAKVSKDDPDGVALATKLRDGVIKQASMAFQSARDEITETETEDGPDIVTRRILEIKALYDVCACTQGVFSQAISQLQQFAAAYGQPGVHALGGHARQLSDLFAEGVSSVSPAQPGGEAAITKPLLPADLLARKSALKQIR